MNAPISIGNELSVISNLSNDKCWASYTAGLLLGIPIAIPDTPFYVLSYVAFFLVLLRNVHSKISIYSFLLVLGAMLASLFSNLASIGKFEVQSSRMVFTTLFFVFFSFGWFVPNRAVLVRGFTSMCNLFSLAVIGAALAIRPWTGGGLLMFSMPEYRLWGFEIFPDWPNYLAFMLSIGFLINSSLYKRPFWALSTLLAALLTTSRTPLIALGIYTVVSIYMVRNRTFKIIFAITIVTTILGIGLVIGDYISKESDFVLRLLVFSDRIDIYGYALELISKSPIFGMGSVLFDESVGHQGFASYHNSYLDIFVRHGIVGLVFFLLLIWPIRSLKDHLPPAYWSIIFFFVIGSFFQNFFKHPHFIMLYSTIICSHGHLLGKLHDK
ncbi:MAG TPA: O-antigen ligase family protein [Desulfuromonadales bacterium]|nr:O-antigen ligase family protein [Desulfuromonadales bacterium]